MTEIKTKTKTKIKAASQPDELIVEGKVEGPSSSIKFYIDKHDPRKQTHRALFLEEKNIILQHSLMNLLSIEKIKHKLSSNFGGLVAADLISKSESYESWLLDNPIASPKTYCDSQNPPIQLSDVVSNQSHRQLLFYFLRDLEGDEILLNSSSADHSRIRKKDESAEMATSINYDPKPLNNVLLMDRLLKLEAEQSLKTSDSNVGKAQATDFKNDG